MNLGKLARDLKPFIQRWVDGAAAALRLDDLADVAAPSPAAGNVLQFDGTNWIDADIDPTTTAGDMIYRGGTPIGNNIALNSLGLTTFNNDYKPGFPGSNAFDADDATFSVSNASVSTQPFTDIDLQTAKTVRQYRLLQGAIGTTGAVTYYVYSSDDGVNWAVREYHTSTASDETVQLSAPITARYWRFRASTGSGGHEWYIYTIELHESVTASYLSRLGTQNVGDVLTLSAGLLPAWSATATAAAHASTHENGGADELDLAGLAVAAEDVTVTDSADYFTGAQVEAILAEIGLGWAKLARANTFTAKQVIVSADEPYSDLALDVHNGGGVELITAQVDRDFSGAGNWSGTNWAISGGKYVHTAGSTAAATLANANLTAGSIMAGRYYAITFTLSGVSAGFLTARIGTGSGGAYIADGTYTCWALANADDVNLTFTPTSTFNGAIDDVSVKLVPAQLAFVENGHIGLGFTSPDADAWMHVQVYDAGTTKLKFENKATTTASAAAVECKVDNGARVLLVHGASVVTATSFAAFANRGGLITDPTYGLGIGIAARQAAGDIKFYAGGVANTNEKMVIGVTETVFNDLGDSTVDLRAESDTEANMIFLDASADTLTLGGTTNGVQIAKGGHVTLNGTASVFDDLNFDPGSSGGPAATLPDYVTINNVIHREFTSANNQLCGDGEELPHAYKLSSTIYPHVHIFLKGGESAGTTGVTFTLYWELRQSTGTTSGSVTLAATSAQLGTTAGANKLDIYDSTGFAGAAEMGAQLALKLARTAGDAGDVVVTTYGVHYEIDSIGSNTATSKT